MGDPFEKPAICLITPGIVSVETFESSSKQILSVIRAAVDQEISLIQIREKHLTARLLYRLAVAAAQITNGTQTRLLINDRADVALAAGADGVHLTSISCPAETVRNSFPDNFLIGVSTHTLDEVVNVKRQGADFAVFGPIFETPGKDGAVGPKVLERVCKSVAPFPVIGLGGIDNSNCDDVIRSGAAGVAAIRSLNSERGMRAIVEKLRQ